MGSISSQTTLNQLQNNTNKVQWENGQKNLGKSSLTREGFLQLIMAQMQYQDPTEPQDYSQMLGQQVQLQMADEMNSMVSSTQFSQASNMIGKSVTLPDGQYNFTTGVSDVAQTDYSTNQQATKTGVVQSVRYDQNHGKAILEIDSKYYDAAAVQSLRNS
jgi:flagellar basal-body rod modification protein FlgD